MDSLLIPPANLTDTLDSFTLTGFEGALYSANKIENFTLTANCTIFVPQNEAFEALGPAISNMTIQQLTAVLDYHIIPSGVFYSPSLTNGTTFTTIQGSNITIRQFGNNVYVNSAQLLTSDVLISNGVIHVIDNVLNPEGPGAVPNPQIPSQAPVFASASSVDSLPFTTAIPCTSACPTTAIPSSDGTGIPTGASSIAKSTAPASPVSTSSSKAFAVPVARETGFGAVGLVVALSGAALLI